MNMKDKFIKSAIKSFGGFGKHFGVFTNAGYQGAIHKEFGVMPSGKTVRKHLKSHDRVLQLNGGCHWKYS